jgi:hypothetical protein
MIITAIKAIDKIKIGMVTPLTAHLLLKRFPGYLQV